MNTGPDPMRPHDEPHDPLLDALRQRLGESYGAPPPPGAWAGIRQRLPARPPLPWWRRPRRLLPLLLLLLGVIAVGTLTEHQLTKGSFGTVSSKQKSNSLPDIATTKASQSSPLAAAQPALPDTSPSAIWQPPTNSQPGSRLASSATEASASALPQAAVRADRPTPAYQPAGTTGHSGAPKDALAAKLGTSQPLAIIGREQSHRHHQLTRTARYGLPREPLRLSYSARAPQASRATAASAAASAAKAMAASTAQATGRHLHHQSEEVATAKAGTRPARGARQHTTGTLPPAMASRSQPATTSPGLVAAFDDTVVSAATLASSQAAVAVGNAQPLHVDSLALKLAALVQLPATPLPTLATQPDSTPPLVRGRRWSLLAVAGPTLSYRIIGSPPTVAVASATTPYPATTLPYNTITPKRTATNQERPAAGLAAQVQVRRVLSGRWTLALGLGYQEYATGLTSKIADSVSSIYQRDTYRLLTLPVQLTYALGAPRSRLAKGLLLGAVPGWYLGGRSTEGTKNNQQQDYSSAAGSPYHAWNLALSLGLDLRYRVGSPASRWQVVVQPTAHYIVTPFVRSEATSFSQRQPFSLGVLTGVSWDIR